MKQEEKSEKLSRKYYENKKKLINFKYLPEFEKNLSHFSENFM